MTHSHSFIAIITGALAVNVNTPYDAVFSYNAILGLVIFCVKALVGAIISVVINKLVDVYKNRKAV